ncbi:hypothetical protein ACFWFF_01415 [Streptomyces sp. NPDC060223]|uniref:hypothetical protein n=1 Tax=unclassified Streptomyces TaxID=2593676 RepID=UPI0036258BFD
MTTQHETEAEAQPAEFAAFIVQHVGGRAHEEISAEMHALLAAVNEHGKKGQLVIKLTVEPPKGHIDGDPVVISIDSELKAPKASGTPSLYFVDPEGNASRNDPRQTAAFDVRDLPTTKTEIKDIQK